MSKDKCKMTRKRFVKLVAGTKGLQVQEVRDAVRYGIARMQRKQEQRNREKYRRGAGGLD